MDIFVIFFWDIPWESVTGIFSIIITNIDTELLSCLPQILQSTINEIFFFMWIFSLWSIKVHLIYLEIGIQNI